tara:strand:- start:31 stop:741 length:711 start_codon:yes stop_codon:yes gene_type:complete
MIISIKKKIIFLVLFFFYLLTSCSSNKSKISYEELSLNNHKKQSINLNDLRINLFNADKKLTPKLIQKKDGSTFYSYIKKPGEGEVSLAEIKERVLLGPHYYKNDRKKVINLLKTINELNINNKLEHIQSGALGLWIPSKELIVIDYRVAEMGSAMFLDVLSHEVIHLAQSCFSGSKTNLPERIGLPLEFSRDLNLNLSHKLYINKSEEVMNLEREAFTYSKIEGMAIKLLKKFCK